MRRLVAWKKKGSGYNFANYFYICKAYVELSPEEITYDKTDEVQIFNKRRRLSVEPVCTPVTQQHEHELCAAPRLQYVHEEDQLLAEEASWAFDFSVCHSEKFPYKAIIGSDKFVEVRRQLLLIPQYKIKKILQLLKKKFS
jgi:hypothetical protein